MGRLAWRPTHPGCLPRKQWSAKGKRTHIHLQHSTVWCVSRVVNMRAALCGGSTGQLGSSTTSRSSKKKLPCDKDRDAGGGGACAGTTESNLKALYVWTSGPLVKVGLLRNAILRSSTADDLAEEAWQPEQGSCGTTGENIIRDTGNDKKEGREGG